MTTRLQGFCQNVATVPLIASNDVPAEVIHWLEISQGAAANSQGGVSQKKRWHKLLCPILWVSVSHSAALKQALGRFLQHMQLLATVSFIHCFSKTLTFQKNNVWLTCASFLFNQRYQNSINATLKKRWESSTMLNTLSHQWSKYLAVPIYMIWNVTAHYPGVTTERNRDFVVAL